MGYVESGRDKQETITTMLFLGHCVLDCFDTEAAHFCSIVERLKHAKWVTVYCTVVMSLSVSIFEVLCYCFASRNVGSDILRDKGRV